jgi:hypothetical protein
MKIQTRENSHYFHHDGTTMRDALPRTKHTDDVCIDVRVWVGSENVVGRYSAPRNKFIEKAVWWNAPVQNSLFRCLECHLGRLFRIGLHPEVS